MLRLGVCVWDCLCILLSVCGCLFTSLCICDMPTPLLFHYLTPSPSFSLSCSLSPLLSLSTLPLYHFPLPISNGEGRKRTLSGCSSDSVSAPLNIRKVSWRQKIFLRVASPMNKPTSMQHPGVCVCNRLATLACYNFCSVRRCYIISMKPRHKQHGSASVPRCSV